MNFHPIADIFPLMSDEEFVRLSADIKEHGLQVPIKTFNGLIIDGRNRFQACREVGVEPRLEEWTGAPEHLAGYVISLNLHRRHLNESQRAMVAAKLANLKGPGRPSDIPQICGIISQSAAAQMLNVSERSVSSARKVLDRAVSEVIEMVEQGDMSVSAGATFAEQVPLTKQKRFIRKKGKDKLVSYAQNLRVAKTLKVARTTLDVCLCCNPDLEISEETFIAFLQTSAVNMSRRKGGAYFARFLKAAIEEIEDGNLADEISEVYEKILLSIDAGRQTEAEIVKFTGETKETIRHALSCMEGSTLESLPQGGKTAFARGQTKTLWQRKVKTETEEKEIPDDDEFVFHAPSDMRAEAYIN